MDLDKLLSELQFKTSKSSGAGGQHVNKVSTKVALQFHILHSEALSDKEKERLIKKLQNRLIKGERLQLHCDETRSQKRNKELAIARFLTLLSEALKIKKKRKKTKPTATSVQKRLRLKKATSQKKATRKKPPLE